MLEALIELAPVILPPSKPARTHGLHADGGLLWEAREQNRRSAVLNWIVTSACRTGREYRSRRGMRR